MNMKNILVCLFVLVCFAGCNKEDKELKKLQIENEKMKGEILKKQVESIAATEKDKILFQLNQLKNAYQRRIDVVHKLVEFLASHKDMLSEEGQQSLTVVTEDAFSAGQFSDLEDREQLSGDKGFPKFKSGQDELSSDLARLLLIIEEHPNLKAMQEYVDLRTQVEATENRVTVEQMRLKDLK